jgi:hypothetical protein
MTKQLTYEDIQRRAGCEWRIGDLAEILAKEHPCDPDGPKGDFDSDDCRLLARRLMGIETVLDMLKSTPNAYVNREALDLMAQDVIYAEEILSHDWVKELLERTDEILERNKDSNSIPF